MARRMRVKLEDTPEVIEGVTMRDLEPHMCKWPIGDPQDSNFRFCGKRRIRSKPYCEKHCRVGGIVGNEERHNFKGMIRFKV